MAVPNMQHVIERVDREHPGLIKNPHAFTAVACAALHAEDERFGLNGKRGNPHDTSEDCTAALDTDSPLVGSDGRRIRIIDFVIGAGGDNPRPGWLDQTEETIRLRTTGVWVQPDALKPSPVPQPPVQPPPSPNPQPPAVSVGEVVGALLASLDGVQRRLDAIERDLAGKATSAELHALVGNEIVPHIDDLKRIALGMEREERFR